MTSLDDHGPLLTPIEAAALHDHPEAVAWFVLRAPHGNGVIARAHTEAVDGGYLLLGLSDWNYRYVLAGLSKPSAGQKRALLRYWRWRVDVLDCYHASAKTPRICKSVYRRDLNLHLARSSTRASSNQVTHNVLRNSDKQSSWITPAMARQNAPNRNTCAIDKEHRLNAGTHIYFGIVDLKVDFYLWVSIGTGIIYLDILFPAHSLRSIFNADFWFID